ncbi:MAG: HEAT repeat domain-containing protein [Planctomycetota bacterium]|nr:HEAT repeat domain-containing protein [Planctomycetota bacterium]
MIRLPHLLGLVLLLLLAAPAWPDDVSVPALVKQYEGLLVGRADELGYQEQREVLGRLAALRSQEARMALARLRDLYGPADRRRSALILGALVRYGAPRDLDAAIDWVEGRKDPLLLDLLHQVVAEARLPNTRAHLRDVALRSATPRVKAQIVQGLAGAQDTAAVAPLLRLVREPHLLVRVETLIALGRLGSRRALPVVQVFLRDADVNVRDAAARSLGLLGIAQALPALERALNDDSARVAESAAKALARIDDHRAIPALLAALERVHGQDVRLADAVTMALQALSGKAIQDDPALWRAWWLAVKDRRPFVKSSEKPGTKTVAGPRYYGFPVRSSKVVFVVDVSRSMGWNGRLKRAKEELVQVLEQLPRTTRFKVLAFSDDVRVWPSKRRGELVEARPATVQRAINFVKRLKPMNGTHTYAALAAAFEHPDADTVFLLSDGNPSGGRLVDTELIRARVRDWNRYRRVRVHTVFMLLGQPPRSFQSLENPELAFDFMQRLATENDGQCKKVR